MDEVCVDKSQGRGGRGEVDTGEESGQIGGHTGKEVRVPRAGRRGGFAPVSPGGFIEPHTAWYGVPATVLYAMYQNAADPRLPRCRRRRSFANSNVVMETFFILNLYSHALASSMTVFYSATFIKRGV